MILKIKTAKSKHQIIYSANSSANSIKSIHQEWSDTCQQHVDYFLTDFTTADFFIELCDFIMTQGSCSDWFQCSTSSKTPASYLKSGCSGGCLPDMPNLRYKACVRWIRRLISLSISLGILLDILQDISSSIWCWAFYWAFYWASQQAFHWALQTQQDVGTASLRPWFSLGVRRQS